MLHGRYIDRYEKVSSFLYYVVPALYLYSSPIFNRIYEFGIKRPLGFDLTKINKPKRLNYSILLKALRV